MNVVKVPLYKSDKRRGRPERRKTPLKKIHVDRESLAWAAGFFDGEGSFLSHVQGDGTRRYYATIGQVDRRVLDRLREILQLGKVYGPYGPYNNDNANPHYKWEVLGFEQVQAVAALLWAWLSPVKREQAKQTLLKGRV